MKMKWLRIILPIFFSVGLILCIGSVAYADPGLDVDIDIVGDDADVGVDIYGDNAEVWINGQNLNEPTAVYNIQGGSTGFDSGWGTWVNRRISDSLAPLQFWAEGQTAGLNLTAEGLAKLILLVQEHSSEISTLGESFNSQGRVASILESASDQRMRALEEQQAQLMAELNQLTDSHNRTLAIIIGAFSLVVIALAAGLVLLWRRH